MYWKEVSSVLLWLGQTHAQTHLHVLWTQLGCHGVLLGQARPHARTPLHPTCLYSQGSTCLGCGEVAILEGSLSWSCW